ncbi:MAG: hypothetical protein IPH62_17550 [Ignavibacteriae bacterium]|nr:hypothetical protein [Ignavibacteriota bacterium]
MKTWEIIAYFSVFIWTIVPIFYRSNKHFYFFLLFAINDLSSVIIDILFSFSTTALWIPSTYLIVLSLDKDFFFKHKYFIGIGLIISIFLGFNSSITFHMYFVLASQIILFILFSRFLISIYLDENRIDIFYLTMIFYEALTIFKIIAFLNQLSSGLNIYFATNAIQILIGLFLIYISIRRKNNRDLEGNEVLYE